MPWGVIERLDLLARIERWNQEVVKNTLQQGSATQPPSQSSKSHHMKLRSQVARPPLGEVSGNSYSRKRKASTAMADRVNTKAGKKTVTDRNVREDGRRLGLEPSTGNQGVGLDEYEALERPVPRPRGRPRKNPPLASAPPIELQLRPGIAPTLWPPSGPSSPRKATTSPSKRGQITLEKPIAESAIDMNYLGSCDPPVDLTTFRDLRQSLKRISAPVENLFMKLQEIPHGRIPSALEVDSSLSDRRHSLQLANTFSDHV